MTVKPTFILLLLTFYIVTIPLVYCTNENSVDSHFSKSYLDTNAYPFQKFHSVKLLVLDSTQQTTVKSSIDKSFLTYVGRFGYSFVDSSGISKTKNYKTYNLDSAQIKKLELFLIKQPCNDSVQLLNTCAPIFRHVFLFYDQSEKPIAQVHICFHCEASKFTINADEMCDFDNKVNFKDLKGFVSAIEKTNR